MNLSQYGAATSPVNLRFSYRRDHSVRVTADGPPAKDPAMDDERGAPGEQTTAMEAVAAIKVSDDPETPRTQIQITLGSITPELLGP